MGPLQLRTVRSFVWFRVAFQTRFYYPIFALLFLDFGLTLEHFALLNLLWAITIVTLEVPSGALADLVGRRALVIAASILMVLEMVVILLAPPGRTEMVLLLFALNRIFSGAAEALASGADEALTYDCLSKLGREDEWPQVLERLTLAGSASFFVAMLVGAAVYDPNVLAHLGLQVTREDVLKLPIWLTLASSLVATVSAWQLERDPLEGEKAHFGQAFSQVAQAGRFILSSRTVLVVIGAVVLLDHVIRLVLTLSSEYYHAIGFSEAWLGVLSALFAGVGMTVGKPARWLAEHSTPAKIFFLVVSLIGIALVGLTLAIPYYGAIFVGLLGVAMTALGFFASHFLNRLVPSEKRATVLSFKGLALNLAYGGINLLYTGYLTTLPENSGIVDSFSALPLYFGVLVVIFSFFVFRLGRQQKLVF